jgi:hypothetical protein
MTQTNVKEREQPQEENLGSFYMGRMRPTPQPRRVLPRGALTFVTLFAFAAIIWYAYPQGQERFSDIDIPVIAADKTAYKFKPDNPGGMEVRHQDSTVFDPLEKKETAGVEHLRPKPEEPMAKPQAASPSPLDKTPRTLDLTAVSNGAEKLIAAPEVKPAPVKDAPKPVAEKPQPKAVTATAAPAQPANAGAAVAGVYIQLGAFRELGDAKADWARLQKKFPESLGKLSMRTERADLGAKGVFYRLQAGKLPDVRAKEICSQLKAGGQPGCIIVK